MYSINKIKTQYPNKFNITNDEQIPIPIETIFFLEDATRDLYKPNRFYFNYPAQWCTANKGESIIGVRNIYVNARRRKLDFELSVRKYYRKDFDELASKDENKDKSIDEIYDLMPAYRKSELSYNITSWLGTEHDLREVFKDVREEMEECFKIFNKQFEEINKNLRATINNEILALSKEISDILGKMEVETDISKKLVLRKQHDAKSKEAQQKEELLATIGKPEFREEKDNLKRRDIQMDGCYDYNRNMFIEKIYSPCNDINKNIPTEHLIEKDRYSYYVDFKINFITRPVVENKQDNSPNNIYDFVDVMNIGYEPFQNRPEKYLNKWMREIEFENVWDRHSCKIYSSFASDSSRGYLGNSQIFYHTIKYFKLNSTDQQFWIEFYSARHNDIPVIIPLNESFNIELQLLPFNKLLYV